MTATELIEEAKKIAQFNLELLKKKFSHLSAEQEMWRSGEYTWNLQEIFAHLNEYAKFYHDAFINKISKTRFNEPKENFLSSPLGRSAWKSMKLGNAKNVKRKFNSPKAFNPSHHQELVDGNDIERFKNNQQELLEILEKSKAVNIRRVKIPLSMSKIVKLRLGDAILFVTYHNERHMQQAINLLAHPKFPKK